MMDPLQQAEEGMLVLQAQAGNREAFRLLVELYDARLLYFIRRILDESEEAFDVLQEVWLRVYRNLKKLRAPQAFRVWLYRIAHDQTMNALRRSHREMPREDLPLGDVPDDQVPDSIFETAEVVHLALRSLSVDHRQVLTLRFMEEMSIEEMAQVLGCKPGTVKSRLHYAKLALARRIEESSDE